MAQCKWCGRSGWLLSVTSDGLCKSCDPVITLDVVQRTRIINDSMSLVKESKKLDTQVSRCDLILEHAENLVKYEERNIPTLNPFPSLMLSEFRIIKDELIIDSLGSELESTLAKVELSGSTKTKINQLSKILLKIREYKKKTASEGILDELETKVEGLIHQTQLNSYLDEAKKAEFKGQTKKALENYYEALYFLRHDEIEDSLQTDHIVEIERKITELGGSVPS